MKITKKELKKYIDKKLIIFSIDVKQNLNEKLNKWKKCINFPLGWTSFTLENNYIDEGKNGLAILTGEKNGIIVIDIDNMDHWKDLLKKNNQTDPDTASVISGSGGKHFYFKYNKELEKITSKDHCFGKDYDIDIKTNGGCVICPPTNYFNNNLKKEVEYKWEKNIFEHNLIEIPQWIKKLLFDQNFIKKENKNGKNTQNNNIKIEEIENEIYDEDPIDENIQFKSNEIEYLINLLSPARSENYKDWVNVGLCLFNLDKKYYLFWENFSKKSDKYEDGACEKKWKTFKKNKDGLKIGSLLLWCKQDNEKKYNDFIRRTKLNGMIISKYPDDKLLLGDTVIVNDKCQLTHLHNKYCLIKGETHIDMPQSMYVEVLDKFMTIKCRHPECFGRTYPCSHILMNKNEMNIAFNGDVTININNTDDDLVEFQKIDIYENEKVNELVFNSLNGDSSQYAEIIYYFYDNSFNYGEDNNWYVYENHKWKNIGDKNMYLRNLSRHKLEDLYYCLLNYYKENDGDKNKIKTLKNAIKNFGTTNLKNNIMTELIELYSVNKNKTKDFCKKLDSNRYLIGFENGIYDLKNFEFREGTPDDFVTLSVGYDFSHEYSDKYHELLSFLEDIQPNKEERDYMITYLSIGLIGNMLELFTILTGCGRNGKSKLIELLKTTLGDYFGSVQSQLFTRPRPDANSPDPGLLSLIKKKIVIASEPEKNSKLNSGFIKFITGRDSTTLRNCHSNDMIDFTAQFITLLICNDIPECDDIDNAFTKRLRCINFPTEFVMEPIKENQKKINTSINENFAFWKNDFMLLLIEYYKKYTKTKELRPTNNILKWTDQYKDDTDMYLQFLNENTEETKNEKDKILCVTLYDTFKFWFKENNPYTKIPSSKEFLKCIKKYVNIKAKVRVEERVQAGIEGYKLL
jgi:P4 family phage/plasmid primase-like protien